MLYDFLKTFPELLTASQVAQILNMSKASLYAGVKTGQFPAPIKLSPRRSRWEKSAIVKLLQKGEA